MLVYLDHRARFALVGTLSREETQRLQELAPDSTQWGSWALEIHASGVQRNRQYRAYSIIHDEHEAMHKIESAWSIHGYSVTLAACECMDFFDRRLPCKHIYAAALASEIILPLTQAEYEAARNQGIEIIFEFPTSAEPGAAANSHP